MSKAEQVYLRLSLRNSNGQNIVYLVHRVGMPSSLLQFQLPKLDNNIGRWNILHDFLFSRFSEIDGIAIPKRLQTEFYIGSLIFLK